MTMNEISTFRIGNQLNIRWPILTNGEEIPLAGRNLQLYLTDPLNKARKIGNFDVEGNVILWTYPANEQELIGIYHLTLFENKDEGRQSATDYMRAFRLVAHSSDIPSNMQPGELPLSSTGIDVGQRGLSAYEIAAMHGYEGTEEQWARDFDTVLSSSTVIVEAAQEIEQTAQFIRRDAARIAQMVEQLGHAGMMPVVEQTEATVEIAPNVMNTWPEPMASLTVTFAEGEAGYNNEYVVCFRCPDNTATDLHLPEGIRWMGGEEPDPKAGHYYEITVANNRGICAEF